MKLQNLIHILIGILCIGLLPRAQAVVPPPDGGYPGFNTAEGQNALSQLTTGIANTAVGWYSLFSNTDGSFNTAVGAGTLLFNVGDQTTGEGTQNTAVGAVALLFNTTGSFNTAIGEQALFSNDTGTQNTASGVQALYSNIGHRNTATGAFALLSNTTGSNNTAIGRDALMNNTVGGGNTAIGHLAGSDIDGDGNVCIGTGVSGVASVNNTTWIGNVYDSVASDRAVYVNSDNKIGTLASSRRYKNEIKPMDKASEAILSLKPVTFRYKQELDAYHVPMFGLIAEEVEEVSPDLVTRGSDGNVNSVRYDAVNAMLLNEFLKEHRKNEEQQATIARLLATDTRQQKQIEALTAALQKVSAQLELSKAVPQTVNNP